MLDNAMGRKLFSLAELNHLRVEAMQLYEQCLTNGDDASLVDFVQRQITHEPPHLQLLRDIADDLQQRLLSLREYHFDTRERVVAALSEGYGIDITPLAPSALLERYHYLTPDEILDFARQQNPTLAADDLLLLRKMIDASLRMAAQLRNDIEFTARLYHLVLDWAEAISITLARQHWNSSLPQERSEQNIYH
jgi:hypothetical protein